jgi:hypothetical protein
VGEKIWGYKAVKFIMIIMENVSIIIFSLPFSLLFRVNLTSFLNTPIIFFEIFNAGEEIFHKFVRVKITIMNEISHLIEKIEELGSNTENKLFIILWGFLYY